MEVAPTHYADISCKHLMQTSHADISRRLCANFRLLVPLLDQSICAILHYYKGHKFLPLAHLYLGLQIIITAHLRSNHDSALNYITYARHCPTPCMSRQDTPSLTIDELLTNREGGEDLVQLPVLVAKGCREDAHNVQFEAATTL